MSSRELFHGRKAGVLLVAMLASCIAIVSTATAQARQGYLGVTTQTLTNELREGLGFRFDGDGALVSNVSDGSPADRAGLRPGDVITRVGTESISGSTELRQAIRAHREGDVVTVRYLRDGSTRSSSVRLAGIDDDEVTGDEFEWRSAPPAPPAPPRAPRTPSTPRAPRAPSEPRTYWFHEDDGEDGEDGEDLPGFEGLRDLRDLEGFRGLGGGDLTISMLGRGRLGVRIEDLDQDLGEYFRVPSGRGALVMGVVDDSPAKRAGIRAGDVITKVNDRDIDDTDGLIRTVRELDAGNTRITLVRRGTTQTITVDLPRRETPRAMRFRTPARMRVEADRARDRARAERDRVRVERRSGDADLQREIADLRRELAELRRELDRRNDR